jgi:hypothetical protein
MEIIECGEECDFEDCEGWRVEVSLDRLRNSTDII